MEAETLTIKTIKKKASLIGHGNLLPFALLTSLFALWGLASNMTDTLLAAFKRIMSMDDFQTSWIQFAFYGSYFCLALPGGILIKKYSYKAGILLGLGMFGLGGLLFYPASLTLEFGHFLIALFILAGGLAILETAANPYIIALGPQDSGTRRLNLAQSFNPVGCIIGVLLSKIFILSQLNRASAEERLLMRPDELRAIQDAELFAVMAPYVGVSLVLIVLWIVIRFVRMPNASDAGTSLNFLPTSKRLLKRPDFILAVVALFFYVGAQICVWSFSIRYAMAELNLFEADASTYYVAALILFAVSRFIFTALMKFISPNRLLLLSALMAALCTLLVILSSGYIAVFALVAISGFMSLMFPTIFGLGLTGLGDDTKIAGSYMMMAISGGAVLTAIQGLVSDMTGSIHLSFSVPLICFIIIAFYAGTAGRAQKGVA